jgi:tRNA-splicing ligase RtcB
MVALIQETPVRWRIARKGPMRVPGVVFASERLLPDLACDRSLEQVANVATLPGIVVASFAMPDMHWGYGFPIGGVAATDVADGGVVSPGGVGFDISCGVRLLGSQVDRVGLGGRLDAVMDRLGSTIPRGMGRGGLLRLSGGGELTDILLGGSTVLVERGHGEPADLERCEDHGRVADADPGQVSARAIERGRGQVGSLGSGNHFLEVQGVDAIYDQAVAEAFGLAVGQVCVMIHSGSRGLGHQICTDHVATMVAAMPRYGITVPDPQLACVPVQSAEGAGYLGAMAAAANYGRANRQMLAQGARHAFDSAGLGELALVYDVSHNLAKLETHRIDGAERLLCVHRKGATRAWPPGHRGLPEALREHGQPVLVPGSMGTASYVLVGTPDAPAFQSTCHGAGRVLSRHAAVKKVSGAALRNQLAAAGVAVRGASARGLAEEAPLAYKDVDEVVRVCELAGLARRVARLVPLGVVKG